MMTRRLWESDLPQMLALISARAKVGKQELSDDELQHAMALCKQGVRATSSCFYWGTFIDGKLNCFLTQLFDERWPATWNMSFLTTAPESPAWSYKKNGLEGAWKAAFSWGNFKGRKQVGWSLPVAWAKSVRFTAKTTDVWLKYQITDLAVIEAGSMPSDDFQQWLYGSRVKPYAVQLRTAVRAAPQSPAS